MSAEAAIYPTPFSVSNRFFQNFSTFSAGPARRLSAEPAASKEVAGASQATFSRKKRSSSGRKYLEALSNYSAFPRSAASNETEFPGQPIFSFLSSLPAKPAQSTKTTVGAPGARRELERDSTEAAELSDQRVETQAPRGPVSVRGAWPRSEGRLLGSLPRSGKREIRVSSPIVRIPCA